MVNLQVYTWKMIFSIPNRKIGVYTQGEEGPLLVFIGGIHGNEPSGVSALVRVFDKLALLVPSFKGKVVGVRGNMAALSRNVRYIDKDLNRLWSESAIRRVKTRSSEEWNSEEGELMELLSMIEKNTDGSHAPEILIDLHTTSAPNGLFSIVSDDPFNIQLASAIYAPVILGLTESLTATTNIFMKNRGYKGLAFEAGQHTDPASVDNHEGRCCMNKIAQRQGDGMVRKRPLRVRQSFAKGAYQGRSFY
ncbi:MAG: succinylglutamate desuccinylase/aspartoacylase family protein [Bacteroidia bacterium]|nr:succinylglutamate desuccinylase/aspartoacylase family protein [Bacteroidia bacterium]